VLVLHLPSVRLFLNLLNFQHVEVAHVLVTFQETLFEVVGLAGLLHRVRGVGEGGQQAKLGGGSVFRAGVHEPGNTMQKGLELGVRV